MSALRTALFPPIGAGTNVTAGSASTTEQDLGAHTTKIIMQASEPCRIRFGETGMGAAVSTDFPINADVPYVFDIHPGCRYFRAIRDGSNDSVIVWAVAA